MTKTIAVTVNGVAFVEPKTIGFGDITNDDCGQRAFHMRPTLVPSIGPANSETCRPSARAP